MVTVKGEEVIEYYHRGVVFHLVGFPMAIPLDVEMIQPAEGGSLRPNDCWNERCVAMDDSLMWS